MTPSNGTTTRVLDPSLQCFHEKIRREGKKIPNYGKVMQIIEAVQADPELKAASRQPWPAKLKSPRPEMATWHPDPNASPFATETTTEVYSRDWRAVRVQRCRVLVSMPRLCRPDLRR